MRGVEVQAFRIGRHKVEAGHLLRVLPSRPGKRDGFVGKVRSARVEGDVVVEVTVVGAPAGRPAAHRTFTPARLAWVRQPKV